MKNQKNASRKVNRVCFLNPHGYFLNPAPLGKTDTGGQTIYVQQLARALGKKGVKVDIFTRQFDNMPSEEAVWENVNIIRIPAGKQQFIQKEKIYELLPEMAENIMHFIEKKRRSYDVIHSHYWDGGYAGILLAKMLDVPHVWTPHSLGKLKKLGMSTEKLLPTKLKPAYRYHVRIAIEQQIINKANAIAAICETNRIQLLEHYLVDFEKIQVIYPGIDIDFFTTKQSRIDSKVKLKKNSILTVSRFAPAKGLDLVIEALSLLKGRIPFHLYLAGGSAEENKSMEEMQTEQNIHKLIKRHKLDDQVTFVGHISHDDLLPAYYRKADLFILGSRFEPFGLTTFEAMACGTTPIISNLAGSKEVIVDQLNGFIVDTSNKRELSETIFKVLSNEKLRRKIADNAAFTMKEHYSWDKIVEKFISLYKRLG